MTIDDPVHGPFIRKVLDAPHDDLPRLVLADWLDENAGEVKCPACDGGQTVMSRMQAKHRRHDCPTCKGTGRVSNGFAERAEFVRVQCELASGNDHGGGKAYAERREALRQRERELWNESRLNGAPHPWIGLPKPFRGTTNWLSTYDDPVISTTHKGEKVEFRFVRGFVGVVKAKIAVLVGGVCERCGGSGYSRYSMTAGMCGPCHGTGRTPGIAREITKCQPVESWVATDAQRYLINDPVGSYWFLPAPRRWYLAPRPDVDTLPEFMWDSDSISLEFAVGNRIARQFSTRELALAALSRAIGEIAKQGEKV